MEFPRRKYRVISLSIGARKNKIFRYGDIVNSDAFYPNQAKQLALTGHLEEINPLEEFRGGDLTGRKIRLVIATMMWGRFDLFRFWASQIDRLRIECPQFDIIALAVGSEGEQSREVAESCGVNYYEFPNHPINAKANARLRFCAEHTPDFILFLGSDDIVSGSLLNEYYELMIQGFEVIESKDMYFFDAESKRLAYCEGYLDRRKGEGMAVGRCISSVVAKCLNWELWPNSRGGMDSKINRSLKYYDFSRIQIETKGKHLILDIKGRGGINTFKPEKPNWKLIDLSEIRPYFDDENWTKLIEL